MLFTKSYYYDYITFSLKGQIPPPMAAGGREGDRHRETKSPCRRLRLRSHASAPTAIGGGGAKLPAHIISAGRAFDRQLYGENAALTGSALGTDATAVVHNTVLYDRKSQTRALYPA